MTDAPAVYGLILAGGQSSRMGHDKSLIDYHGAPQREYLHTLLKKHCAEVFISCKTTHNIPYHLSPLPDQFELESPLNGILSAFHFNASVAWLTVPVDMPFVNDKIIHHLIQRRDRQKVATCFYDSTGKKPEPLLTLWEPKAFAGLQEFFTQGNISPRQFLMRSDINILTTPDPKSLLNINDPDDLRLIRESLK